MSNKEEHSYIRSAKKLLADHLNNEGDLTFIGFNKNPKGWRVLLISEGDVYAVIYDRNTNETTIQPQGD